VTRSAAARQPATDDAPVLGAAEGTPQTDPGLTAAGGDPSPAVALPAARQAADATIGAPADASAGEAADGVGEDIVIGAAPEPAEGPDGPPAATPPPVSENRSRAERTAPLFAELATLEKGDPRRERLRELLVEEHLPPVQQPR
jgi:RNA polymerase sigma-B factor